MDGSVPWRGAREKHRILHQMFIEALTKPGRIVVDVTASTGASVHACLNSGRHLVAYECWQVDGVIGVPSETDGASCVRRDYYYCIGSHIHTRTSYENKEVLVTSGELFPLRGNKGL